MPRHPRGAADPEPGDQRRLSPEEVVLHRVRLCVDLASLMLEDIATVPPEMRPFLLVALEALVACRERLEGRR